MRFVEIHLRAFGPFTGARLDFSSASDGLHVLYGPNEAGKSSARRGILALLFGFPHQSSDDFVHDRTQLRVGARLLHSAGTELLFFRRKGNKRTLLGSDDSPLADDALVPYLGGVGEDLFATLFAIDHDTLVRGGAEIVRGGGQVGQALFAAGTGGLSVRRVLEDLDSESKALFLPRGQNQPLNRTIADYQEAARQLSAGSLSSREWVEHTKALEVAEAERVLLADRLRQLRTERERLSRLQRAIPKLALRQAARARLAELVNVPVLPDEFGERRRQAVTSLEDAQRRRQAALDALGRLEKAAKALEVPEALLSEAQLIRDLHKRLGGYLKAEADLPNLIRQMDEAERKAAQLLADVWPQVDLEEFKRRRPTLPQRVRLNELSSTYDALVAAREASRRQIAALKADLASCSEGLQTLEAARDPHPLRQAIARARRQGQLEVELEDARTELQQLGTELGARGARLPLWKGDTNTLERSALPSGDTVARFEARFVEIEAIERSLSEQRADREAQARDVERVLEEIRLVGAVPTEDDLSQARQRREHHWQLVRRAWLKSEDLSSLRAELGEPASLPEAYEKAVRAADDVADRLRNEAQRVAQYAQAKARQSECLREVERLRQKHEQSGRAELVAEWESLWSSVGIKPLNPKEMRFWLNQVDELRQQLGSARLVRTKIEQLERRVVGARREAESALGALGEAVPKVPSLEGLLEYAEELAARIEANERRRHDLAHKLRDAQDALTEATTDYKRTTEAMETWRGEWAEAVTALGLGREALPREAMAVRDRFEEVAQALDEAAGFAKRVSDIRRDSTAFVQRVSEATGRLAQDLASASAERAVEEIHTRFNEGLQSAARISEIDAQIEREREALAAAERDVERAVAKLNELCQQAGCSCPDEVAAIEEQSAEARELRERVQNLEREILEDGAGASVAAVEAEALEVQFDLIPALLSELEREIGEAERREGPLSETVGSERRILEGLQSGTPAAEIADRVQALAAEIRELSGRYVRLRLASAVLKRQIESYRSANQGPVVRKASDIFARLTLGSFSGLRADFDEKDEPILVGIRSGGQLVRVEGMSDGTRDQLYLALRLASLYRFLDSNEALPLLVDDILINFDDGRAEATLRLLTEVASRTQVLFFTHHRRLVEIARAIGSARVVCHELPGQLVTRGRTLPEETAA